VYLSVFYLDNTEKVGCLYQIKSILFGFEVVNIKFFAQFQIAVISQISVAGNGKVIEGVEGFFILKTELPLMDTVE
jgi:multisubunit Na+/H+ antiporter MnhB subunit